MTLVRFKTGVVGLQFATDEIWIRELGIHYKLGVDGLNLTLIVLAAVLFAASTAWAAMSEWERPRLFFFWLALAETGVLGALLSQDLALFVIFFDVMLVPFLFLGHERAQDAALGQAEPQVEEARALPLAQRRPHDAREEEDRREHDEEEVQPVDADLVVDAQLTDPRLVGHELQPALAAVEAEEQDDGQHERARRAQHRREARLGGGQHEPRDDRGEREPDEDGQVHELWMRK